MVWLTPRERAEQLKVQLERMVGDHGVTQDGREWIHWQRQASLFDVMREAGYAGQEKRFEYNLPGHGSQSSSECGKTYAKGCDRNHVHENKMDFVRLYRHNCRSRSCPVCYESWGSRAAENIMLRMATYAVGAPTVRKLIYELKEEMKLKSNRDYHQKLVLELEKVVHSQETDRSRPSKPFHFVLSPPNPTEVKSDRKTAMKLRNEAYRIARKRGINGACLVPHSYRLRCAACHSTIPDYKKECPGCGSQVFEWFWSYHFHGVGFGWVHGVSEGFHDDGWIVRNLGLRKSVFWTAQYILSHAGISDLYTVTWFGDLSYRNMAHNKPPKVERIYEVCPFCMEPLKMLLWLKGADRPPPEFDRKHPELNEFLAVPMDWRAL